MNADLYGKTVLVTGGGGGLGAALCHALAGRRCAAGSGGRGGGGEVHSAAAGGHSGARDHGAAHARELLAMSVPAVFLDKDGTLIENLPYNVEPARIRLAPGALDGMARLHACGFMLVVVTNQAGVALGRFEEGALRAVEQRLKGLAGDAGVPLAAMYWCPHHPAGTVRRYAIECGCRKPQAGLLRRAGRDLGIDLERSWMVGDILDNIEAGRRAGCRTVLLDNRHETEWRVSRLRLPHLLMPTFSRAAQAIAATIPMIAGDCSERLRSLNQAVRSSR